MKVNSCLGVFAVACLIVCTPGCSQREGGDLSSIPSTFTGTLTVQPPGRFTKDLYIDVVRLSRRYGFDPKGDGANDGKQWQIQIACGKHFMGGFGTGRGGELLMFGLALYAFHDPQDYERFKAEMLGLMKPYGELSSLKEHPPLGRDELLKRGAFTGFDVTTKCGPPAVR